MSAPAFTALDIASRGGPARTAGSSISPVSDVGVWRDAGGDGTGTRSH